jgi:hypothetical protein
MSDAIEHGFKEGDKVWVQDGDGKRHPGVFVGDNEAAGWFGGGPSAYVVHPRGPPGRGGLALPHHAARRVTPIRTGPQGFEVLRGRYRYPTPRTVSTGSTCAAFPSLRRR